MSLFPTVLHEFEVPTFKQVQQDLIKQVYKERKKDPVGREMTNVGGWQSQEWGGWHSQGKDFDRNILSEFIVKEVSNYFTQNKILKSGTQLYFSNWWININKKGDFNEKHVHPASHFSGVCYLQVPSNSGTIVFDSPHLFTRCRETSFYNPILAESFNIIPALVVTGSPGKFLIFPSDLLHGVEPSKSREDRISLSFNINLT